MVSIKLNLVVWRWKVFEVVVEEDVDMKFVLGWGVFQHFKQRIFVMTHFADVCR